jgi:2-oxoglutarate/2-oxoacid ferredoxin oxidoreductase subunit beta
LIKAAVSHNGIAVLDIISPCVTFNNEDHATHSYAWGKEHEVALHDLAYVPPAEEIMVEYKEGEAIEVTLHDGSMVILKKLERDFDPTRREDALRVIEEANSKQWLITGLLYIKKDVPTLIDQHNLPETPLNRLPESQLRPSRESLEEIMKTF